MTILPVYNLLTLPDSTVLYRADLYKNTTGKDPVVDEKVIVVVSRNENTLTDLSEESIYPVGVSGYMKTVSEQGTMPIRSFSVRVESTATA